jgi:hypothetical protein
MDHSSRDKTVDALIADPAAHFASPMDVVDAALSPDVKQRILDSWELDARRLDESASENMAGGEASQLRAVTEARQKLDETLNSTD